MLAKDVLRVLGITRPTLTKYVKTGIIRVTVLPNKRYDYNEEDVYGFLNKDMKRKTFIYARVSTAKQKPDLENQISLLKQFCFSNGYTISGIYSDIASGISFVSMLELTPVLWDRELTEASDANEPRSIVNRFIKPSSCNDVTVHGSSHSKPQICIP